jgi:hypothetical protein
MERRPSAILQRSRDLDRAADRDGAWRYRNRCPPPAEAAAVRPSTLDQVACCARKAVTSPRACLRWRPRHRTDLAVKRPPRPLRACSLRLGSGDVACGGVDFPDLPGGIDQVDIIRLRRHLVFFGLCEESAEPQRLFEESQGDIERLLPFLNRGCAKTRVPRQVPKYQNRSDRLIEALLPIRRELALKVAAHCGSTEFSHRCAGRPARSRWCKSTAMKE